MDKLAVIALGGNALLRDNEKGTIEEQEQNTDETLENILFLLNEGYNLVITHGNGPQVGNILMRNDAGEALYGIAPMPLDICVADSQGGIGYMIERILRNVFTRHGIRKSIVTLVTMVCVDPNDPAFESPSKQIGNYYTQSEAEKLANEKGWRFAQSAKNKLYRRVVASPKPTCVLNYETIRQLAQQGHIVIAVGGGGVPVYFDEKGMMRTENAVVDKDLASAVLAHQIGADALYILTDVPFIYKDYNLPTQEKLEFLDYETAKNYLVEGTFGEGSMKPKIVAALEFIRNGGEKCIITEAKKLKDKSYGSKITMNLE